MYLILLTALTAVCAGKLDHAHLPPCCKNTGSTGGLFRSSAFDGSVQGVPAGGYSNDFEGVVVDAVAPGSRIAPGFESALGGLRESYGSTNSKVGDAAFKTKFGANIGDGITPSTRIAPEFQSAIRGPNGADFKVDDAVFKIAPGFNSNEFVRIGSQEGYFDNSKSQAHVDKQSNFDAFDSNVEKKQYHFGYHANNAIAAGGNGVNINGIQAEGDYSNKGDDGQVYKVTYTDEGGFKPKCDHLPTPPLVPFEIVKSIEENVKKEFAGHADVGSYNAQKYNEEGNSESVTYNSKPQIGSIHGSIGAINQNTEFGNRFSKPESNQVNLNNEFPDSPVTKQVLDVYRPVITIQTNKESTSTKVAHVSGNAPSVTNYSGATTDTSQSNEQISQTGSTSSLTAQPTFTDSSDYEKTMNKFSSHVSGSSQTGSKPSVLSNVSTDSSSTFSGTLSSQFPSPAPPLNILIQEGKLTSNVENNEKELVSTNSKPTLHSFGLNSNVQSASAFASSGPQQTSTLFSSKGDIFSQFGKPQIIINDGKYTSSTVKPTFLQNDNSYYYRKPSTSFVTPVRPNSNYQSSITQTGTQIFSSQSSRSETNKKVSEIIQTTQNLSGFEKIGQTQFVQKTDSQQTAKPQTGQIQTVFESTQTQVGQKQFGQQASINFGQKENGIGSSTVSTSQTTGQVQQTKPQKQTISVQNSDRQKVQGSIFGSASQSVKPVLSQTSQQAEFSQTQFGMQSTKPQSGLTYTESQTSKPALGQISQATIDSTQTIQESQLGLLIKPEQNQYTSQEIKPSFGQTTFGSTQAQSGQIQFGNQQSKPFSGELQQHTGELYEYKKPAETLTSSKETSTVSGTISQTQLENVDPISQQNGVSQTNFVAQSTKPQFGQTRFGLKPVFGQTSQTTVENTQTTSTQTTHGAQFSSKPQISQTQFGLQHSKPGQTTFESTQIKYGQTQFGESQFGSKPSKPVFGPTSQTSFGNIKTTSTQTTQGIQLSGKPRFGLTQIGQTNFRTHQTKPTTEKIKFGSTETNFGQTQFSNLQPKPLSGESQQHIGELYEYKKPAETFTFQGTSTIPGTVSQTQSQNLGQISQQTGVSEAHPGVQSTKPQFGLIPSKPILGQTSQTTAEYSETTSESIKGTQFGAKPEFSHTYFGSQYSKPGQTTIASTQIQNGQTQFEQTHFGSKLSKPISGQTSQTSVETSQTTSTQTIENSKLGAEPQFGQSLFGSQQVKPTIGQTTFASTQLQLGQTQIGNQQSKPTSGESQQQTGELYEYNKPSETFISNKETSAVSGTISQTQSENLGQISQQNAVSQTNFGVQSTKPQFIQANFGSKPDKVVFGQTPQTTFEKTQTTSTQTTQGTQFSSTPQFSQTSNVGLQHSKPSQTTLGSTQIKYGQTQFGKSQFGSKPSKPETTQTTSTQSIDGSQFGAKPLFGQTQLGSQQAKPTTGQTTFASTQLQLGQTQFGNQQPKPTSGESQQQTGELYEYNKPSETFISNKETSAVSGTISQTQSENLGQISQQNAVSQTNFGVQSTKQPFIQANFGSKPDKVVFGQTPQTTFENTQTTSTQTTQGTQFSSTPQFSQTSNVGLQHSKPSQTTLGSTQIKYGQTQFGESQFGSKPSKPETTQTTSTQSIDGSQFGAKPLFGQTQLGSQQAKPTTGQTTFSSTQLQLGQTQIGNQQPKPTSGESQQQTGELYEYNKPSETFISNKETSAVSGTISQTQAENLGQISQQNAVSQTNFGVQSTKPQLIQANFVSKPDKVVFGQTPQTTFEKTQTTSTQTTQGTQFSSTPQFSQTSNVGLQHSKPSQTTLGSTQIKYGQTQFGESQFGSKPSKPETTQTTSTQSIDGSQFGAKPLFGQTQLGSQQAKPTTGQTTFASTQLQLGQIQQTKPSKLIFGQTSQTSLTTPPQTIGTQFGTKPQSGQSYFGHTQFGQSYFGHTQFGPQQAKPTNGQTIFGNTYSQFDKTQFGTQSSKPYTGGSYGNQFGHYPSSYFGSEHKPYFGHNHYSAHPSHSSFGKPTQGSSYSTFKSTYNTQFGIQSKPQLSIQTSQPAFGQTTVDKTQTTTSQAVQSSSNIHSQLKPQISQSSIGSTQTVFGAKLPKPTFGQTSQTFGNTQFSGIQQNKPVISQSSATAGSLSIDGSKTETISKPQVTQVNFGAEPAIPVFGNTQTKFGLTLFGAKPSKPVENQTSQTSSQAREQYSGELYVYNKPSVSFVANKESAVNIDQLSQTAQISQLQSETQVGQVNTGIKQTEKQQPQSNIGQTQTVGLETIQSPFLTTKTQLGQSQFGVQPGKPFDQKMETTSGATQITNSQIQESVSLAKPISLTSQTSVESTQTFHGQTAEEKLTQQIIQTNPESVHTQFGVQATKPLFATVHTTGSKYDYQTKPQSGTYFGSTSNTQFGSQFKPQFGAQPTEPTIGSSSSTLQSSGGSFSIDSQNSASQSQSGAKLSHSTSFGNTQPQFGTKPVVEQSQAPKVSFQNSGTTLHSSSGTYGFESQNSQFGAKPFFGSIYNTQPVKTNIGQTSTQFGTQSRPNYSFASSLGSTSTLNTVAGNQTRQPIQTQLSQINFGQDHFNASPSKPTFGSTVQPLGSKFSSNAFNSAYKGSTVFPQPINVSGGSTSSSFANTSTKPSQALETLKPTLSGATAEISPNLGIESTITSSLSQANQLTQNIAVTSPVSKLGSTNSLTSDAVASAQTGSSSLLEIGVQPSVPFGKPALHKFGGLFNSNTATAQTVPSTNFGIEGTKESSSVSQGSSGEGSSQLGIPSKFVKPVQTNFGSSYTSNTVATAQTGNAFGQPNSASSTASTGPALSHFNIHGTKFKPFSTFNGYTSNAVASASSGPQFSGYTSHAIASASSGPQFGVNPTKSNFGAPSFSNAFAIASKDSSYASSVVSSTPLPVSIFGSQTGTRKESQFGSTLSTPGFNKVNTAKPTVSQIGSLIGKGEHFGGPRDSPSFNDKTGYHY